VLLHTSAPGASAVLPDLLLGLARSGLWCSLDTVTCGDDEDVRVLVEDRRAGTCLELLLPRARAGRPEPGECWAAVTVATALTRPTRVGPPCDAPADQVLAFALGTVRHARGQGRRSGSGSISAQS
jgi:hypothetical protein